MTGDVLEALGILVKLGEHGNDLCHFRTGDGCVRTEGAVGIAVDDAGIGERGDRVVEPVARLDVRVGVVLRPVEIAGFIGEQTEEDGRDLGAGDGALRLHRAVGIADNVGIVVSLVQLGSNRRIVGRCGLSDEVCRKGVGLATPGLFNGDFAGRRIRDL